MAGRGRRLFRDERGRRFVNHHLRGTALAPREQRTGLRVETREINAFFAVAARQINISSVARHAVERTEASAHERRHPPQHRALVIGLHERLARLGHRPEKIHARRIRCGGDGIRMIAAPTALAVLRVVSRLPRRADRARVVRLQSLVQISAPAIVARRQRLAPSVASVPTQREHAFVHRRRSDQFAQHFAFGAEDVHGRLEPVGGHGQLKRNTDVRRGASARRLYIGDERGKRGPATLAGRGRGKFHLPPLRRAHEGEGPRILRITRRHARRITADPQRFHDERAALTRFKWGFSTGRVERRPRYAALHDVTAIRIRLDHGRRAGRIHELLFVQLNAMDDVQVVRPRPAVLPKAQMGDPVAVFVTIRIERMREVGIGRHAHLQEIGPPEGVLRVVGIGERSPRHRHARRDVERVCVIHKRPLDVHASGGLLRDIYGLRGGEIPVGKITVDLRRAALLHGHRRGQAIGKIDCRCLHARSQGQSQQDMRTQ